MLDAERTLVMYNGDWLSKLSFKDVIDLAANFTLQQFLVRENFSLRFEKGDPISLHELFYTLMQGYDAVAMRTDLQIGGTDQLFNLLAGRKLMEAFGLRPQTILTFPILVGTDGVLRMSKTTATTSASTKRPQGHLREGDEHPGSPCATTPTWSPAGPQRHRPALCAGDHRRAAPARPEDALASEIVNIFQGDAAAVLAKEHFRTVFQQANSRRTYLTSGWCSPSAWPNC